MKSQFADRMGITLAADVIAGVFSLALLVNSVAGAEEGFFTADEQTIGAWNFTSGGGQELEDTSRVKNTAILGIMKTPDSADPQWTDIEGVSALLLDGIDDCITIPNNTAYDVCEKDGLTIELIIRPLADMGATGKAGRIILVNKGFDSDKTGGWSLDWDAKFGVLRFLYKNSSLELKTVTSEKTVLKGGEWNYIAVTVDAGTVAFFLNGKELSSHKSHGTIKNNTKEMMIGLYATKTTFALRGVVQGMRLSSGVRVIKPLPAEPFRASSGAAVLAQSDFRDGSAGWKPISGAWKVIDGEYGEHSAADTSVWSVCGERSWTNYRLETAARTIDGGSIAVAFRWQDVDNHYHLECGSDNAGRSVMRINKVVRGRTINLRSSSQNDVPEIPSFGANPVMLTIVVFDELIQVYANNKPIMRVYDQAHTAGCVALGKRKGKAGFGPVRVAALKAVPYAAVREPYELAITHPDHRYAFLRGEKAEMTVSVRNNTALPARGFALDLSIDNGFGRTNSFPFDAVSPGESRLFTSTIDTDRWKAQAYTITAELRQGQEVKGGLKKTMWVCRKTNPERFKYYDWGTVFNHDVLKDLAHHGYNGVFFSLNPDADFEEQKKVNAQYFDLALTLGVDLGIHYTHNVKGPPDVKDTALLDCAGKTHAIPNPWHPAQRAYQLERAEKFIDTFRVFPSFRHVLLSSEIENHAVPSCAPMDKERAKKELGFDMPIADLAGADIDGVAGSVWKIPAHIKASIPAVFSDNDAWYRFYMWFWQRGFGDNILNKDVSDTIKRARSDIETIHDPYRNAPVFHRNSGLDYLSTWYYSNPDAAESIYYADILLAAAKGDDQKIALDPSLWLYSGRVCPAKNRHAGAMPADIIKESLWICLSRRVDRIDIYSSKFIMREFNGEYRQPQLYEDIKLLNDTVIKPLGPMMHNLKRSRKSCAFLISAGAQLYGKTVWGGFKHESAGGYLYVLAMAHIPTDIVLDESILAGELTNYKVLFLHQIDHLPQGVFNRIVDFASAGGLVVTGDTFADKIPGAVSFDMNMEKRLTCVYQDIQNGTGSTAEEMQQELLRYRAVVRDKFLTRVNPYADSESPDVFMNQLEAEGVRYLVLVNDRREYGDYVGQYKACMEKGLTNTVRITLRESNAYLYDIVGHRELKTEQRGASTAFTATLPPAGGTIVAVYPEKIDRLEAGGNGALTRGGDVRFNVRVLDRNGKEMRGVQPLELRITGPDGEVSEYSDYYAAIDGAFSLPMQFALNDTPGRWNIVVRELTSGAELVKQVTVQE